MNYRTLSLALLALALAPTTALRADIIELTNGTKISGTLQRSGDTVIIKSDDGKITTTRPADIAKVTLTSTITPEEAAATDWSRLPAQVKAADDLQIVIDAYKKFLEKYPAAKQAPDAQATLSLYQSLAQNDPVKFRGRWLPRAQVSVLLKQWTDAARPALDLYKAGRMKETLDALAPVLKDDNQNPDALTLAGLASYRSNNLPNARTHFANLAAADPSSLLAENNLAVVSTGQKLVGESFIHYTKALQIMPDQRVLLDNIAEALYAYTSAGSDKNSPAYRALLKAYEPAEARMEETMAKQNLVRWGSTWVTKDQKARLLAAIDSLRDSMARLDAQYNTIRATLTGIQTQIKQTIANVANDENVINTCTGIILSSQGLAVNVAFYAAQRDVAIQNREHTLRYQSQLQAQYDQLAAGTRDYINQAEKFKAAFSPGSLSGQYTGTQRILDLDETDHPPAPTPVAEPSFPQLQTPTIIITPPPAPTPPVLVPIPVNPPVLIPVTPVPTTGRGG